MRQFASHSTSTVTDTVHLLSVIHETTYHVPRYLHCGQSTNLGYVHVVCTTLPQMARDFACVKWLMN